MDYLIDVGLTLSKFLPLIVGLFISGIIVAKAWRRYTPELEQEKLDYMSDTIKGGFNGAAGVVLVHALFVAFTSPTNTPKTDFDDKAHQRQVEQERDQVVEQNKDKEIVDIELDPVHTREERKQDFDDSINDWKD